MKDTFDRDDYAGRIAHAFAVERILTWLGWVVAGVGVLAIAWQLVSAALGLTDWSRAIYACLGILAATVLSGATAYGSGTNVGLAAARLQRDLE